MKLAEQIRRAEEKYLNKLEVYFTKIWGETLLWSHDLDHHRRVWHYAKELIQYVENEEYTNNIRFIEKLLISSYLHDSGMAVDFGERHGSFSRKFCEEFLLQYIDDLTNYSDLLEAIENHDNKEYTTSITGNNLLLILSAADDLDAFGYTGIYRYIEIYILRGIETKNIVPMVLKNSTARFTNFENNFRIYPGLIEKHRVRYQIVQGFFQNLDSDLKSK